MKSFALLKTQQLFLGFFSGHYFDLKLYQKLLYTQMASDIVSFIYVSICILLVIFSLVIPIIFHEWFGVWILYRIIFNLTSLCCINF